MGLEAQLSGTPRSAAYWGMTADASDWLGGGKLAIQTTIADWGVRNRAYGGEYAAIGAIAVTDAVLPESWLDLLPTKKFSKAAEGFESAAKGVEKYTVGAYKEIKGTVPGLDAHHVGQKTLMKDMIPGYDPATAPAILVPKVGHTIKGPNGIVSRSTEGLTTPRDVVARDIRELRRVYPDVPNSQLQQLIRMNKDAYPGSFAK